MHRYGQIPRFRPNMKKTKTGNKKKRVGKPWENGVKATNLNRTTFKICRRRFSSENEAFEATRLRSTAAQKSATEGADAAGPAEVEGWSVFFPGGKWFFTPWISGINAWKKRSPPMFRGCNLEVAQHRRLHNLKNRQHTHTMLSVICWGGRESVTWWNFPCPGWCIVAESTVPWSRLAKKDQNSSR